MAKSKKKKYWYMTRVEECPVCGEYNISKQRVYDREKPKCPSKRLSHCYLTHYCWV